jgi:hypothetical protein
MGVEAGEGQSIDLGIVHRDEEVPGFDGIGHEGARLDFAAAGGDDDPFVGGDAERVRVARVDLDGELARRQRAEDGRFGGARLRVPLARAAAAGEEREGIFAARDLTDGARIVDDEAGAAVGMIEAPIGKGASSFSVGVQRVGAGTRLTSIPSSSIAKRRRVELHLGRTRCDRR